MIIIKFYDIFIHSSIIDYKIHLQQMTLNARVPILLSHSSLVKLVQAYKNKCHDLNNVASYYLQTE